MGKASRHKKAIPHPNIETPGPPLPQLILWFRSISAVSMLAGLVGLIATDFYWWAVGFAYASIGLLLWDLSHERLGGRTRKITTMIVAAIGLFFTFGIVLRPAPLSVLASAIPDPHFEGESFGGIRWKEEFTDVRVWIKNETRMSYQDVDLEVDVDQYLLGAGQLQALPHCSVSMAREFEVHASLKDGAGTQHFISPPVGPTLGIGYRVICDKFPSQTAIQLVLATSTDTKIRKSPSIVTLRGSYHALFRKRPIDIKLRIE